MFIEINLTKCFECENEATEHHHVIPKIKGGTKTIPLCSECHGKVHDITRLSISELTKEGIRKAKEKGTFLGKPLSENSKIATKRIIELKQEGMTLSKIANILNNEGYRTRHNNTFFFETVKRLYTSYLNEQEKNKITK